MNHWKAAAFDLDDTLLHDDLSVSSRTVDIFQRLQRSGFIFIAASGRTRMSMQPFLLTLNCVSFCIACNGALNYNQYNGEPHPPAKPGERNKPAESGGYPTLSPSDPPIWQGYSSPAAPEKAPVRLQ